ncbi:MAG: HEPN domain-containing protein [Gammaproteobacteria bacterium]|nr:HEPN domain-containing protein [Gammaproteobacteria bacterium]
MNKNLDHLPASRQDNLAHIVTVLRDEFEQVTGFSTGKKKHGRILKIILFGSHATGKWVNDPAYGYVSDYDILVIVNKRELVEEYKTWHAAEDRIALRVRQPLNILVHTLEEVNDALIKGQYFFTDIKREGIVLYETDKRDLAEAGNLTPEEYKVIAEKNYNQWFESANEFFDTFYDDMEKERLKKSAFELHQATERYFACLLLVLTNYKPNTHNLKQLNSLAILQNERISEVFPQDTKINRRRFQLLKQAYVDARYSEHYKISQDELEWLADRVKHLQQLIEMLCQEKIASFE